jgi:putative ABC transport system permease protein
MGARLLSFFRAAWQRAAFERDMDDEMRFHLETRVAELRRRGHAEAEATRIARREFGNAALHRDRCRDARWLTLLDDLKADVRFALRAMRKDVQVTLTIVTTLALGIGATTAMFTAVNAALLRPLPFPNPSQLVMVSGGGGEIQAVPGPDFVEWQAGCRACAGLAAFSQWQSTIAGGAGPERVLVGRVTPGFFDTLGVQPVLGRTFLPEEVPHSESGIVDGSRRNVAVILGASLWRRQFHGDPAIVGRTIRVDSAPTTVVGVMPDGFAFPDRAEAWVPADVPTTRRNATLRVIARLADGVSVPQGVASFQTAVARSEAAQPDGNRIREVSLVPLQEFLVGDVSTSLAIFLAAVGLVLLIACANVASLLLAQAAARPQEMAIRTMLGAGRRRLIRQLLTESLLLAAAGGIGGLLLAAWLLAIFRGTLPESIPRLNSIAIDRLVVAFVAALSIGVGLLFGLVPAMRTSQAELSSSIKAGGTRRAAGPRGRRIRGALVVAEVSMAIVLLVGAGLLVKSFVTLRTRPLGFTPAGVVTANITLPEIDYPASTQARAVLAEALTRLQSRPGIDAAGIVTALPLSRHGVRIRGDAKVDGEAQQRKGAFPAKIAVGGDYFGAMRIPLLKGRLLSSQDSERAPAVVVVSESFANRLWPNQDPLGHRVRTGFGAEPWATVVGVVADVKHDALQQNASQAVYHPIAQIADDRRWFIADVTFVLRAASQPAAVSELRETLRALDGDLPVYDVQPMGEVVAANASDPRFYALLMGAFSFLAFVLAIGGLYGVVSYSVRQRTHEIGIRLALGAGRRDIAALVLREGLLLVGVGTVLGLLGAYTATRALASFLFRVTATDPATFAMVPILLCLVGLLACYIPARRATGLDPLRILKYE